MKKWMYGILFCGTIGAASAQETQQTFGESFTPHNVVSATQITSLMAGKDTVLVQAEAVVKEVCQQKGCWMKVDAGNGQEMLVRFKGYSFFVPKDAAGKKVILKGKAFEHTTPVKELRHYAEDGGKSKKEIAAIKKPQTSIRFVADGVMFQ